MFYERGEVDLLVESSRKGKWYLSRDLARVISAYTGMKRLFLRSEHATNISERCMVSARLASMVKLHLISARLRHFGVAEFHNRDPLLIRRTAVRRGR